MTTPRDAIGLSDRLRERVRLLGQSPDSILKFMDRILPLIEEAATQLDALQARVKELEQIERNRDMWKGQCERQAAQLTSLREDNDMMHDLVDQRTVMHHDAEAKCDDLAQQLKDLRVVANYNREQAEAAEARAIRAGQQRDEAYERLKPFADTAESLNESHLDRMDIWGRAEGVAGMKITDEMVRVARETFDNVSGSPLELATNDAWREALEAALAVDGVALVPREPTAKMIAAAFPTEGERPPPADMKIGAEAIMILEGSRDCGSITGPAVIEAASMCKDYRKMIAAASDREERRLPPKEKS